MATKKSKNGNGMIDRIKMSVLNSNKGRIRKSNFYILETIVGKKKKIQIPQQNHKTEKPSYIVFADDAPLFNWGHPCRYLLFDAETGEQYKEINAQLPPYYGPNEQPKSYKAFHEPVRHVVEKFYPIDVFPKFRWRALGKRYAILYSGLTSIRHTNDLEFAYRTLRNVYGFAAENITVLHYDGTLNNYDRETVVSWPGDNSSFTMPVNGTGKGARLLKALDDLKMKLQPDDLLFIHTSGHGGHNGFESELWCYPHNSRLGVQEFTDKLATLPKYNCLMVMMEQCNSGGFNNAVIYRSTADYTSIASACLEYSRSRRSGNFDSFAMNWIAAMNGVDPYGNPLLFNPDLSGNGFTTAQEAFDYADVIHDPCDSPFFNATFGASNCWLGREYFHIAPIYLSSLETLIRRRWPEPDPEPIREFIEQIDKRYLALEEKTNSEISKLVKDFEKQAETLLQSAMRKK